MSSYVADVKLGAEGELSVAIEGVFDETVDVDKLLEGHEFSSVCFDFKKLKRINSSGVRRWLLFLQNTKKKFPIIIKQAPPPVVEQMNLIAGFLDGVQVESIYLPYLCSRCGHEEQVLVKANAFDQLKEEIPVVSCPNCNTPNMEFDYLEEEYLHFLTQESDT